MKIPHATLVLVVDGRKMILLRNQGDEAQIDLRIETEDEQTLARDHELKTDLAGQSPAPANIGHHGGTMKEPDYQQQDEDRWARKAAEELQRRALANDFPALVVIAPPKTLGVLRQHYHKAVEALLIGELHKEMTDRPVPDIEALVTDHGAPPQGGRLDNSLS
ncbi:MAG: host attachment family protein [Pseudomonadota bacterium]